MRISKSRLIVVVTLVAVIIALSYRSSIIGANSSMPMVSTCFAGQTPNLFENGGYTWVEASVHYPEVDNISGSAAISDHAVYGCFQGKLEYVYYNGAQTYAVVYIENHGTDVIVQSGQDTYIAGIEQSTSHAKIVYVPILSLWVYNFPNGTSLRILDTRNHLLGDAYFEDGAIQMRDTYMPQ